jgi:transcriptional regulator GlxA family with amidase domain
VIELLSEEGAADYPGKELIIQRLLKTLLIEALRWDFMGNNAASAGLLNGLRDPAMARVLPAIHEDVRARWTVADLAGIAGMSRSGFAARFNKVMGCAPIEYLARWRIAIAKHEAPQEIPSFVLNWL